MASGGASYDNLERSNAKTAYDYEVGANRIGKTYSAKIGMPYISEYYYAATSTYWIYPGFDHTLNGNDYTKAVGNNWMISVSNNSYWTITSPGSNTIIILQDILSNARANFWSEVRPTFNLVSSVKTSGGSGTQSDPYRIEI